MPDEMGNVARPNEPLLEINTEGEGGDGASTIVFILTIVLLLLVNGFFIYYKFSLDSSVSDKTQALGNVVDQLHSSNNKKIESKADSVNSAVKIMTTASKTKYSFKTFMDELTKKITNDTKLNSLAVSESGLVSVDGQSKSYRSVADLALALKSSPKLTAIEISGLTQGTEANLINFSLTAQIKDWKVASSSAATGTGTVEGIPNE